METSPKSSRRYLNATRKSEIVAILSVGGSRELAARYVGCCRQTIRNEAKFDAKFAQDLRRSEHGYEVKHLRNVDSAAGDPRYWRAAAWVLERRFPRRYAAGDRKQISPEAAQSVLEEFARIVAEVVTELPTRRRLLRRLKSLIKSITKKAI
jgi:hypothetical protein